MKLTIITIAITILSPVMYILAASAPMLSDWATQYGIAP